MKCAYILVYKAIYATTPTLICGLSLLRSNKCNLSGKMKLTLPRVNMYKCALCIFTGIMDQRCGIPCRMN